MHEAKARREEIKEILHGTKSKIVEKILASTYSVKIHCNHHVFDKRVYRMLKLF